MKKLIPFLLLFVIVLSCKNEKSEVCHSPMTAQLQAPSTILVREVVVNTEDTAIFVAFQRAKVLNDSMLLVKPEIFVEENDLILKE